MHKSSLIPNDDGVFPLESDMQGNLPVSFGKGGNGCACILLWSCSGEQHLESDARVMRHVSGNGISRGVKPADNVRPTQSEGKEGLTL